MRTGRNACARTHALAHTQSRMHACAHAHTRARDSHSAVRQRWVLPADAMHLDASVSKGISTSSARCTRRCRKAREMRSRTVQLCGVHARPSKRTRTRIRQNSTRARAPTCTAILAHRWIRRRRRRALMGACRSWHSRLGADVLGWVQHRSGGRSSIMSASSRSVGRVPPCIALRACAAVGKEQCRRPTLACRAAGRSSPYCAREGVAQLRWLGYSTEGL